MSEIRINAIADRIIKKLNDIPQGVEPDMIVYMEENYFQQLQADLHNAGQVSAAAYDFIDKGTILGYPVFCVVRPFFSRHEASPPTYRVVSL